MTKKKTKTYIENNPKSMLLIKSAFGQMKSFKMIPITEDCPYVECLFSPREKMMVVISKFMTAITCLQSPRFIRFQPRKVSAFKLRYSRLMPPRPKL